MRKKVATTKQWLSDYRYKAGNKNKKTTSVEDVGEPSKPLLEWIQKSVAEKRGKTAGKTANKRRYPQSWSWTIFLS